MPTPHEIHLEPCSLEISFDLSEESPELGKEIDWGNLSKHVVTAKYLVKAALSVNGVNCRSRDYVLDTPHMLVGDHESDLLSALTLKVSRRGFPTFSQDLEIIYIDVARKADLDSMPDGWGVEAVFVQQTVTGREQIAVEGREALVIQRQGLSTDEDLQHLTGRHKLAIKRSGLPYDLDVAVRYSNGAHRDCAHPAFFSLSIRPPSVLKASLLHEADITGDINLIGKDGTITPAHSAVLGSIPYFTAKLKDEWSGTGWNAKNKMHLALPCPAASGVVGTFLKYAYGDTWSLRQLSRTDAQTLQELFSLADACGLLALCSDVSDMVVITPDTAAVWLDFLSKEHGADVGKLFGKVRHVIKERFDKDALWEGLNVEQVSRLEDISRSVAGCSLVE